ncbi:MAG: Swt1 family HEPN domain-containing protein [Propionicimonas sp.]|uniref:Swt1 family HEPN domain-containing protein n=1 Tax=Propionicimonas sp. TaxID=1955623 RepID=UPI003D0A446F
MAVSNRDRIGQMFEAMAPALDAFIADCVPTSPGIPTWVDVLRRKDEANGITGKAYDRLDPQAQLRMLTEAWRSFDGRLGRVHSSYASELRDIRNSWAHNAPFSDDDAYRALDTAERLLAAINAPEAAEKVRGIRLNLRRVTAEKDDRRTLKSASELPTSTGLRPWREVLPPHTDVATGNFQAAEFAADLYKVAHGTEVGADYADPREFFARTYLTTGLRDLIGRSVRRLAGDDNASPVINLQTNFGGGKTHSMLSLWHLASGQQLGVYPQDLQELLAEAGYANLPTGIRRVALVGNHLSPAGLTKPDGTRVNTIWGELAWQLGGAEAFAIVAESDAQRTPPGDALHTLLARCAPALILIDEWVAYARSLVGRDDLAGGTFDDQFTFAQALTEAVKGTSGTLLAISIPASETGDDSQIALGNSEEVGGTHGLEALRRLQNVVRRIADQWRPASADEAYHIVRQRLFTEPDSAALAEIGATAKAFVEFYRRHSADFPLEARDAAYERRIRETYPIHPELFDRLYQDWSSLERFQRTRGVLRLMNAVIHALWVGEDGSPLILPGSIPLATGAVNAELTQYLQDSWKAVIDADVDGPGSEPVRIDTEKPLFGQRAVTKRLARTVFFGAAPTIGSAHKGIETQRVFLGMATPGDVPGNFHSALNQLADRATYFYTGQGKHWYDLQANISRRAKDQAERLHPEDVWAEVVRRLDDQRRSPGDFAGVHVCPQEHGDIPDSDEARLVIVHPGLVHKRGDAASTAVVFAKTATERRGPANRVHRNMVVFLAADADRMAELDHAVRDYLGWAQVLGSADELDLTRNQLAQAQARLQQADQTVGLRLLDTYQWALVPEQPDPGEGFGIGVAKVEGQARSLAERASRRLGNDGKLNTQQAAGVIRMKLDTLVPRLWESGHVRLGDLWGVYTQYPYMPRLRDRGVLNSGLLQQPLLPLEGLAFADSWDEDARRYRGLVLGADAGLVNPTDDLLVVKPELAEAQLAADRPRRVDESDPAPGPTGDAGAGGGRSPVDLAFPATPVKVRFFGAKELSADRYAVDFKKVVDEVLVHLAATPGVRLSLRVEIEADAPGGFDEGRVRTVSENAATLRFEQAGFEDR